MNSRNCSVLKKLLIVVQLLVELSLADNRVKRLSDPEFNKDITLKMARYVVSIRSRTPIKYFGDNHFCSGAIVAKNFVVTSANCVIEPTKIKKKSRTIVVVGGTPKQMKFVDDKTVILVVFKIYAPLEFVKQNTHNIALLQLKDSWPSDNPHIGIVTLPRAEPQFNMDYTVLSWGRMYKRGPYAAIINHINVTLFDVEKCKKKLRTFTDDMLCAGDPLEKIDRNPCGGDIGAPMVVNDTLYGLVSYRLGCGTKNVPSVYTNVWYHSDWINQTIASGQQNVYYNVSVVKVALIVVSFLMSLKIMYIIKL